MGNTQANEKHTKAGKSPGKGKHFIRNLNRKGSVKESKKKGRERKKSNAKRDTAFPSNADYDKTPDSDNNEAIEASDNDTAECVFNTAGGVETSSVQSEVTVTRCEARAERRSPTPNQPQPNDSNSESVFTEPLTPLAVELNQCYYSAESDSAHDEPLHGAVTPTHINVVVDPATDDRWPVVKMPRADATTPPTYVRCEKENNLDIDAFDENFDSGVNEKTMGGILTRSKLDDLESNECGHDFLENRLKPCPGQTSFTLSKHRKVELPPVTTCEESLGVLENENDRRHSSLSDTLVTESNVLRKVASLTLDKLTDSKVTRPKFVPEKLDFQLYEKFEGQMLLNWFVSSIADNSHLKNLISPQDLKNIGIQYCTHLLAAGVLRQISDKDAPTENVFKPSLMYYWAHMEAPASQPVTPGRLQMCTWPPEKDMNQVTRDNLTLYGNMDNNQYYSQNNNDEINDIQEAKAVISQLKKKLQELECQLQKVKINNQIEILNKNWQNTFISMPDNNFIKDKVEPLMETVNKEVQTCKTNNEINKLANIHVLNTVKYDTPIRTKINDNNTLGISRLPFKNEIVNIESKSEKRSERIENYCKLNKSREYNKPIRKDDVYEHIDNNNLIRVSETPSLPDDNYDHRRDLSLSTTCESSSDTSFASTYTSSEMLIDNKSYDDNLLKKNEILVQHVICSKDMTNTSILFSKVDQGPPVNISQSSIEELVLKENNNESLSVNDKMVSNLNSLTTSTKPSNNDTQITCIALDSSTSTTESSQAISSLPPPLPGKTPSPPPAPGTHSITPELLTPSPYVAPALTKPISNSRTLTETSQVPISMLHDNVLATNQTPSILTTEAIQESNTEEYYPPSTTQEAQLKSSSPSPIVENIMTESNTINNKTSSLKICDLRTSQSTSVTEIVPPPPPPMPEVVSFTQPPQQEMDSTSPAKLDLVPPPPPMPELGPQPPLEPGFVPPPPLMPGMGPPPPSMPEMVPPPPPMAGMGPPPPPMPGMVPPPPPMPGMGPPPPPMPGMGPPPPPIPGMGPPPPPMPGMGPPPPPMPGMGPPPPPMPGMGPPPPPMPGMGPPPPPMPGMGPPPPPMPGMGPPPPPMPGGVQLGSNLPPPPPLPLNASGPNFPAAAGATSHQGPLPFPAPPVGGWNMQRATMRKTPVKPTAPMKPLYWTRILAAPVQPVSIEADQTKIKPLWLEIEETRLDNIDEFTDLFSRQVVKAPAKKKVEVKMKKQAVKLLDSKRSQNVGILAQSLHVEFSEIENAIYYFDASVVSLEALQQIYDLRASDKELELIEDHLKTKPDIPLDKPEAFLHDLSGIANFAERISCFMFQAEFEDAVNPTMHKLDNLKHTCEFLTTSEPLKQLFAIILTLGNYMNGGNNQRGQADGFGLEILAKLKDVKSKDSQVTLLHFIVRTYMRSRGGALSSLCALPVPEPGDVARAAALDFADVANDLKALRDRLEACREQTTKVIECETQRIEECESPSGDNAKRLEVFKEKMTTFLDAAEEKLNTEKDNLDECRAKFVATMKFYQYTPKSGKVEDCEPKEFFSFWTSFCSDFKDIFKKEEQIAIKEKLKENKKLEGERKSLTRPKKEGGLKARLQKLSTRK